jgi:hypothetical protein
MGSAVIFAGSAVKTLKNQISLNGGNDIITSTTDPTSSAVSANIGSLLLNSSNGKLYRKNDSGSSTNWTEVGSGSQTGINYISNPNAATNTTGWSTYKETDSVTFQDTGDTVTLNSHGIAAGSIVAFTSITSTTGISTNTNYYVVNPTTNTFQLASSIGGSALALTTNGSGTMVRAVPKTGTGGTPNVTWTRSTTTPLRGAADFNYSKGAANYMGEGVATDFTIDNADIAKAITIKFDYENLSGTYTTGDLTVYIIADPSGTPVIIQPAGYQIVSASAGTKMSYIATFQTQASGTSYRMVVHTTTPSTSAYDFAFDNFSVGPNPASLGVPITDWQSYTPTGSWTANSTYTGQWRRVGDSAEIHARVACSGAPTSANLTINIPSGLVIDTAKLTSSVSGYSVILGQATLNDSNTFGYKAYPVYSSTTAVLIAYQSATTGAGSAVTQAAPFTFGNGDSVEAAFMVPIVGWSSNSVMSSDTATNVVACMLSGTSTSVGANTTITPTTIVKDTNGGWSGSTYTIPVSGYYSISGSIQAGSNTATYYELSYKQNSLSSVLLGGNRVPSGTSNIYASGSSTVFCNAGDTIIFIGNNQGTTQVPIAFTASIFRISGPAQIGATDTVACFYNTAAGNTLTNTSFTFIDFGTKVFDKTNSVVGAGSGNSLTATSTWRFVVPVSGIYQVSALVSVIPSTASALDFFPLVYKNGTVVQYGMRLGLTTTGFTNGSNMYSPIEALINCNAGDYISIAMYISNGANRLQEANTASNYVNIVRVGN